MSRAFAGMVVLAGLLIGGCGLAGGKNVVKLERNESLPKTTEVGKDGTYALYAGADLNSMISYPLMKGEKIGFDKDANDALIAVAGKNSYPIKTGIGHGPYYWKEAK